MKIFELYFNPKKEDKFCESFHYEPKDVYQRRIGRLYMVGEVNKARKADSTLLSNVFPAAKEKYYEDPSLPPDKALKEALKEVNKVIEKSEYSGKVAITFLSSKNFSLYMGKVGKVKTFLLSNGKIADIGKEVEESGSLVFQNIVCGKMKNKDKIVVLTSDMYTPFVKGKILEEMAQSSLDDQFMEKISSLHEKKFPDITGASLIIDYTTSIKDTSIISSAKREGFSFKKTFQPFVVRLNTLLQKKPSKKTTKLILALFLVVVLGAGIVSVVKNIKETKNLETFSEAVEVIEKAELAMQEGELGSAVVLFEDAVSQLSKINSRKAEEKREELLSYLYALFGREEVEDVQLLVELNEVSPESISVYKNKVYLFSSNKMVVLSEDGEYEINEIPQASLSTVTDSGVMFFSPPSNIVRIINGDTTSSEITPPYEDYSFSSLSSFNNRAYFLEENKDEIIFYGEKHPSLWIKEGEKKHENGKNITIDRSIYVLDKENHIHRYYTGSYEEKIDFAIYPLVTNIEKIYTAIDIPLFLVEPVEKRVIVMSKEGDILKQIYNEEFHRVKDIATSSDGKKIYLLVDQKVYLIEL